MSVLPRLYLARRITILAIGAGHDDCADALVRVERKDAAGARCLVVGMSVHGHQGQGVCCHGCKPALSRSLVHIGAASLPATLESLIRLNQLGPLCIA